MNKTTRRNFIVITGLVSIVSIYNYFIYTSEERLNPVILTPIAMEGQALWQQNNCWSCHQIYGLGGYLGPDLTNVYSNPGKGANYIKAFLNSGVKAMPKFNFSDHQKDALVAYLQQVDSTGYYPITNGDIQANGWVKLKYKHEE